MTVEHLPVLKDEGCTQCCGKTFSLSVDYTDYSSYSHKDGQLVYGSASSERSSADKSVRFYCTGCGTHHQVPKEIA